MASFGSSLYRSIASSNSVSNATTFIGEITKHGQSLVSSAITTGVGNNAQSRSATTEMDLEAVRIQVICYRLKSEAEIKYMTVDPNITSYASIYLLLQKAFNLDQDFDIVYRLSQCQSSNRPEIYLSLTSDWDLDAAFHTASDPILQLKVQPFEREENGCWDLVDNMPINTPSIKDIKSNQTNVPLSVALRSDLTKKIGKVFDVFSAASEKSHSPISNKEWLSYFDETGRVFSMTDTRLSIFSNNLDSLVRQEAWPHILGIFPVDLTSEERNRFLFMKTQVYKHLKENWMAKNQKEIEPLTHMIQKDVLRTDRTHPFFNVKEDHPNIVTLFNILTTFAFNHPEVSYCQGMSDLASPLLVVLDDEVVAYLCFCKVMERLKNNFLLKGKALMEKFSQLQLLLLLADKQLHDHVQTIDGGHLYFCYRMLLLELKREFPFEDAINVMEMIWSSSPHNTDNNDNEDGEDFGYEYYQRLVSLNHQIPQEESVDFSSVSAPKELNDGSPFPLFLCLSIFILNKDQILELEDYTMLAMFFDKLSRKLDATKVVEKGKSLYFKYLKDYLGKCKVSTSFLDEDTYGTSSTAAQC